jgi:hypothetical protein
LNPKRKATSAVSGRIGVAFLVLGVVALIFSVIQGIQILAFVGLGLTFWGALFIMIVPTRFVEGSLLSAEAIPIYKTADRIVTSLTGEPTAYYTPPYPENAPLPDHLKGLKDMVVFITDDKVKVIPDIQELSEGKFIMHSPSGVAITPPGLGLLAAIENKTNSDFAKKSVEELCETLPHLILDNLGMADEIEMTIQNPSTLRLKLINSIYNDLYNPENSLKSASLLGCPIISAVACAVAKATGKPVTIQQIETSPHGLKINATLKIKQEMETNAVPVDIL